MDGKEGKDMELEYFEDIKDDFIDAYKNHIERDGLNPFINWFIHENDLYMTDEYPVENACHYLAIGAYLVYRNKIDNLDEKILDKIKKSYELLISGVYDKYFTIEDKKYIYEDINTIMNSNLIK